jgi:hypothetical protein
LIDPLVPTQDERAIATVSMGPLISSHQRMWNVDFPHTFCLRKPGRGNYSEPSSLLILWRRFWPLAGAALLVKQARRQAEIAQGSNSSFALGLTFCMSEFFLVLKYIFQCYPPMSTAQLFVRFRALRPNLRKKSLLFTSSCPLRTT